MTIEALITYVRGTRDNAFSDDILMQWTNEVEATIQTDVMLLDVANVKEHTAKSESVIADAAHTKLYWLYLYAMICYANGEFKKYQDYCDGFNTAMREYSAWYADRYDPASGQAETQGYYISAYSLAVKHGFEGTEEEWIASVEASRTEAEGFARTATEAAASAEAAKTDAAKSASDAEASSKKAAETAAGVEGYVEAARAAAVAAESAKNSAASAQSAAETAQSAAENARTAAQVSAENAETHKEGAAAARDAAVIAQNAAQAAQAAAEMAQTAAETARDLSITARTAAETAKTDAVSAKEAAETARRAAESAQGLAETAKTAAQGAQTAAQAAQTAAETAEANAKGFAGDAEAWASGTISGVAVPSTHPAYQNNAKWYKDQAQSIVGGDFPTKQEAQGYVTAHNAAADAHSGLFAAAINTAASDAATKADTARAAAEAYTDASKSEAISTAETYTDNKIAAIPAPDMTAKADKKVPAAAGNLAALDESGNLMDSGKAPGDFAAAAHKHVKADITDFPASLTPTVHAPTHATGGSDALTPEAIGASTSFKATGTLTTSGWTGSAAPYTQDLTVEGVLESDRPTVKPVLGTDDAARELIKTAWQVAAGSSKPPYAFDGKITFYAASKPTTNIPVVVSVVRP